MRRLIFGAGAAVALIACTQDFDAFDPSDGATPDAPSVDAVAPDAGDAKAPTDSSVDASLTDTGVVDAPNDVFVDGGTLQFACGNTTVADCAQCAGKTEPCVYCEQNNVSVLAGVCAQLGQSCFPNAPNGFALCSCNGNNVGACPAAFQVCRNQSCRTCSDSNNNGGLTCKGGGTCTNGSCK